MRRGQRFCFDGQWFKFVEWEKENVARVVRVSTNEEVWIKGLPSSLTEIRRREELKNAVEQIERIKGEPKPKSTASTTNARARAIAFYEQEIQRIVNSVTRVDVERFRIASLLKNVQRIQSPSKRLKALKELVNTVNRLKMEADKDRIKREAEQLLRCIPALREFAIEQGQLPPLDNDTGELL